jgi:hypothetical protein
LLAYTPMQTSSQHMDHIQAMFRKFDKTIIHKH